MPALPLQQKIWRFCWRKMRGHKNPDRATVARLEALPNIGKAIAADLRAIGIDQPQQLIGKDAFALYDLLCAQTGVRHDPCVLDVFMAVIHFMNGGEPLPWWSFTDARKEQTALSLTEGA
jgi:hypothetical protein